MTSQNRFFDDISKLMTNAMGVAQGARTEAETAMKGWVDRWLADRDFVTREEFEAVREMAVKARTENAELRARLDRLDPAGATPSAEAQFEHTGEAWGDAVAPDATGPIPAAAPAGTVPPADPTPLADTTAEPQPTDERGAPIHG